MPTRPGRRTGPTPRSGGPQRTEAASSTGQAIGVPSPVPGLRRRPGQARLLARTALARHRRHRGVEDLGSVAWPHTVRASPRRCRACWALAGDPHPPRLRRPVGARSGKWYSDRGGEIGGIGYIKFQHTLSRGARRDERGRILVHSKTKAFIPEKRPTHAAPSPPLYLNEASCNH